MLPPPWAALAAAAGGASAAGWEGCSVDDELSDSELDLESLAESLARKLQYQIMEKGKDLIRTHQDNIIQCKHRRHKR